MTAPLPAIALLLLSWPLVAQQAPALPPDVESVVSGGAWERPGEEGRFRLTVHSVGTDHPVSWMTVDWIRVSTELDSAAVVASLILRFGDSALLAPTIVKTRDGWVGETCSVDVHFDPPHRSAQVIRLGQPGVASATELGGRDAIARQCETDSRQLTQLPLRRRQYAQRATGELSRVRSSNAAGPQGNDGAHELRLAGDVGLAVTWMAISQAQFERRVLVPEPLVGTQTIAKPEVIAPKVGANAGQVQVVRARQPAAKEFTVRYALGAAVVIPRRHDGANQRRDSRFVVPASKNVEDGLCSEPGDRGAACVLEQQREWRNAHDDSLSLAAIESRPIRIVWNEDDSSGLEPEVVLHGDEVQAGRGWALQEPLNNTRLCRPCYRFVAALPRQRCVAVHTNHAP